MSTSSFTDAFKYNPEYHRFADSLGVDRDARNDVKVAKKLALLYDWAAMDTGSKDFETINARVDKLRQQTGVTFVGKELANLLYLRVRVQMDKVNEASRELERRIKMEEKKRELDLEVSKGKEWQKFQENTKKSITEQYRVANKDLKYNFNKAKNAIKTYNADIKVKEAKPFDSKAEYV